MPLIFFFRKQGGHEIPFFFSCLSISHYRENKRLEELSNGIPCFFLVLPTFLPLLDLSLPMPGITARWANNLSVPKSDDRFE